MNLEEFKNHILFKEIHLEERNWDTLYDLLKQADFIIQNKHEPHEGDTSYVLYQRFALKVNRMKLLLKLCADLKKKGVELQWLVQKEDDYYETVLKTRISSCRTSMRKLRPYVLERTKDWPLERKQKDLNKEDVGKYFKGWYMED